MNPSANLTRREIAITELVAWGATAKDISSMLFISPRTVTTTINNIYKKTEVTKVNELSAWYFCKTYHISFELSPLKRKIITLAMIAMVIFSEFTASELRGRRSRKGKDEYECFTDSFDFKAPEYLSL